MLTRAAGCAAAILLLLMLGTDASAYPLAIHHTLDRPAAFPSAVAFRREQGGGRFFSRYHFPPHRTSERPARSFVTHRQATSRVSESPRTSASHLGADRRVAARPAPQSQDIHPAFRHAVEMAETVLALRAILVVPTSGGPSGDPHRFRQLLLFRRLPPLWLWRLQLPPSLALAGRVRQSRLASRGGKASHPQLSPPCLIASAIGPKNF